MVVMPPRPAPNPMQKMALDKVADACRQKLDTARAAREADDEFRRRVIEAANLGCSSTQIAEVASVSYQRVHQIIKSARR